MKAKEKLFGIEFEDGVHDIESDTVEVEVEVEEEEESAVEEIEKKAVEKFEEEEDDEEDFLAEFSIPKRKSKGKRRKVREETEEEDEVYIRPKKSGNGNWKKFVAIGAVVVVFLAIVTVFSLYSRDDGEGSEDVNSGLPPVAMEVKHENAGFNVVVAANEDRVFGVEAVLFGGSNWPVGCDFDDEDSWPTSDFGANRYSFRSNDISIAAGEVKTIFISFNTVETWHCEFTLHEMVGSETQEVLVNMV